MIRWTRPIATSVVALMFASCGGSGNDGTSPLPPTTTPTPSPTPTPTPTPTPAPPTVTAVGQRAVATFDNPWAMTFLPDGQMLVTERTGRLYLVTQAGSKTAVTGVPAVDSAGQLGLLDVVLDPNYATNNRIWFSYAEPVAGVGQQLAVARATIRIDSAPRLEELNVLWRATPATTGGHPGGRLAFSPDRRYLFISTGERQQGAPAQNLSGTLGKIIRLNVDGTTAAGNPFASTTDARAEIWSFGQRNPYGLVFASDGRLFETEMGPSGGDEFNLIEAGRNYGWPLVSEGDDYNGTSIPRHSTQPSFAAPLFSWTPVIAPGGVIQYKGTRFSGWTGDFVLAGLVQQGIVRVRVAGNQAAEVGRIGLGSRTREIEEGPDGTLWVLRDGNQGALVELTPG